MQIYFLSDENGAVSVDWVVLTAALVGLGLATMSAVSDGVEDLSTDIDTQLKSDDILQTAFGPSFAGYNAFSSADWNNVQASLAASDKPTETANQVFNEAIPVLKSAVKNGDADAARRALDTMGATAEYLAEIEYSKAGDYRSQFENYVDDYDRMINGSGGNGNQAEAEQPQMKQG